MRKFLYFSQGECYFDCVFVISFKNTFRIDTKYFPRLSVAVCEAHKAGLKDRHPSTLFLCTLHYSSTHYSTMDFSWPSFHLFQMFCDSLDMLLQSISFLKISVLRVFSLVIKFKKFSDQNFLDQLYIVH